MIKLIVLIFLAVVTSTSNAQWFWGNLNSKDTAVNLTNQIGNQNDTKTIEFGTADPTAVAVDASAGSIYIGASAIFQKQDNGSSTNWQPLLIGPVGSGTDECVSRWDGTGSPSLQDSVFCVSDLGAGTGLVSLDVGNLFLQANTISSSSGDIILDPVGSVNLPDLTASQPAYIDASGNLVSQDIDLTADVSNVLPIVNGGTNSDAIPANGHLLIGNGTDYTVGAISGTTNQVNITNSAGGITLSTPQDLDTGADVTFSGLSLTSLTSNQLVAVNGLSQLVSRATIDLTSEVSNVLPIANGGTNSDATPSNGHLLIGNGTDYTVGAISGTAGQVNVSNGVGGITLSTPQSISPTSSPTFADLTISNLTANQFVVTNGSSQLASQASIDLSSDVSNVLPIANGGTNTDAIPANGHILIGDGTDYTVGAISGTTNQVSVTNSAGGITLSTPQDIHTGASPTFAGATLSGLTANRVVTTDGSSVLTSSDVTDTQLDYLSTTTSNVQDQIDGKLSDVFTTEGDLLYATTAGAEARLPLGSAGQFLAVSGTTVAWDDVAVSPVASVSTTSAYTITTADDVVYVDTTSGNFTHTLFAASGNDGRKVTVKKISDDSNVLTIATPGAETIDGFSSINITKPYGTVELHTDGSNFYILRKDEEYVRVYKDEPNGTSGSTYGTGGAWTQTALDQLEGDGFASLSSNQVTLEIGEYYVEPSVPFLDGCGSGIARISDTTNQALIVQCDSTYGSTGASSPDTHKSQCKSPTFRLEASAVLQMDYFVGSVAGGCRRGIAGSNGNVEIYEQLNIIKVK